MYRRHRICGRCGHHFPLSARQRIENLVIKDSFTEIGSDLTTLTAVDVSADETYSKRLKQAQRRTRLHEAVVTGIGCIAGVTTVLAVFDFRFLGGSMGVTVGEKIVLAFEAATARHLPLIVITSSGGARIQEGTLALMQMAKTAAAAQRLHAARLPFITVLASPTTGGVYASFANLADIILAEPGALIGFAGPRVAKTLTGQELPADSHRAEFAFKHGMVDAIVPRVDLPDALGHLLSHISARNTFDIEAVPSDHLLPTSPPSVPAWEIITLARHPNRPTALDYISRVFSGFVELHGDRLYGDDPAIVGGLARLQDQAVVVVGQERGHDAESERRHHGSARPEGYRKAQRLMHLAAKLSLPLITIIDTPGADPSYESEKRGIAMSIAHSISTMVQLPVPTVAVVVGEGGSGGALALGVADRVLMLENAIYSVIRPEGASAILYGDAGRAIEISEKLRLTAWDLRRSGIIDDIIPEPEGGAHIDPDEAAQEVYARLCQALSQLMGRSYGELVEARYQKYRRMGKWEA